MQSTFTNASLRDMSKPQAIGYVRVSTHGQAESGLGMAAQEHAIREHCRVNGLDLVRIYADPGVSGSKALQSRSDGAKACRWLSAKARKGKRPVIVFARIDRAFRSVLDLLTEVERWRKEGVAAHFVDLGLCADPDLGGMRGVTSRLVLTILGAVAEMERELIRERTKAGLSRARANKQSTGRRRYGFTRQHEPIEYELSVVGWILTLDDKGLGPTAIAKELFDRRIARARGEDCAWDKSTVYGIVKRFRRAEEEGTEAYAAYERSKADRDGRARHRWREQHRRRRLRQNERKKAAAERFNEAFTIMREAQAVIREEPIAVPLTTLQMEKKREQEFKDRRGER